MYADPKIEKITYRIFARRALHDGNHDPRLRGITVAGGRIGVFFSREDLTAGLVGNQVDGILGHDPEVASSLMVNMILYADKRR